MTNLKNREEWLKMLRENKEIIPQDDFEKEALEGLKEMGEASEQSLKSIDNKIEKRIQRSRDISQSSFPLAKWAVAAVLIGVISVFAVRLLSGKSQGTNLYADYFQILPHPDQQVRSSGEESLTWEQKAVEAYEKEDFAQAIEMYEQVLTHEPNNPKHILFLGISYLNVNQVDMAIDVFAKRVPKGTQYDQDIQWYLALAYIKKEDFGTARLLLQGLASKEGYYQEQALMLVEKL